MINVEIKYNPYKVETSIKIDGKYIDNSSSPLSEIVDERLQKWIEPYDSWKGIFSELKKSIGDDEVHIDFVGTRDDYEDFKYAKIKFGSCFKKIELVHKNSNTADDINPFNKMEKLKTLYNEMQNGPIKELKTPEIKRGFDEAINSEFKIVIVAPLSSGKSTFINSLIGENLITVGSLATTAGIIEIKDNDNMDHFIVNAKDKYGKVMVKDEIATDEVMKRLNNEKDPNDPMNKKALVQHIKLEGPIPSLSSKQLNTVFVDTPGGNNSLNLEHAKFMNDVIENEDNNLILYVFDIDHLGTNDSNKILDKISKSISKTDKGKQARDRVLFVINKMDEWDFENNSIGVIEDKIKGLLEPFGIKEPNLFYVSSQTAKIVRQKLNNKKMTRKEKIEVSNSYNLFSNSEQEFYKYSSINSKAKEKFKEKTNEYGKNLTEVNQLKIVEINSGVPAVEVAINEYLKKYAIAMKIKKVRDSFMRYVNNKNMEYQLDENLKNSEEFLKKVEKQLKERKEIKKELDRKKEFKDRVDAIEVIDTKAYITNLLIKFDDLSSGIKKGYSNNEYPKQEALKMILSFESQFEEKVKLFADKCDNEFEELLLKNCEKLIDEYKEYIDFLDDSGLLKIGDFDIKNTVKFHDLTMKNPKELLEKNVIKKNVKVGEKKEKEAGFIAWVKRLFTVDKGFVIKPIYEEQAFVNVEEVILNYITDIRAHFEKELMEQVDFFTKKIEQLKVSTKECFDNIDMEIDNIYHQIEYKTKNRDELKKSVEENYNKKIWLESFIKKMDALLEVEGDSNV